MGFAGTTEIPHLIFWNLLGGQEAVKVPGRAFAILAPAMKIEVDIPDKWIPYLAKAAELSGVEPGTFPRELFIREAKRVLLTELTDREARADVDIMPLVESARMFMEGAALDAKFREWARDHPRDLSDLVAQADATEHPPLVVMSEYVVHGVSKGQRYHQREPAEFEEIKESFLEWLADNRTPEVVAEVKKEVEDDLEMGL